MGKKTDECSDAVETWKAMKAHGDEKRRANKLASTAILIREGIPFESRNNGAHLIIRVKSFVFDFWPSTGLWKLRGSDKQKRGVFKLLDYIRELS